FVAWNLLGILDLVVAVSAGALSSALASGVAGEVTTAPMAQLPLVLIPAYLVPLFIMLHLAALFQARRQASTEHSGGLAWPSRLSRYSPRTRSTCWSYAPVSISRAIRCCARLLEPKSWLPLIPTTASTSSRGNRP